MSQAIKKPQDEIDVRRTAYLGGLALLAVAVAAAGIGFLAIPGGEAKPPRPRRALASLPTLAEVATAEVEAAPLPAEVVASESSAVVESSDEAVPKRGCPSLPKPSLSEDKPVVAYLSPEASVKPPADVQTVVATTPPAKAAIKRLSQRSANDLRQELDRINELAIGNQPRRVSPEFLTRHLLSTRHDLKGLPATMGHECKLEPYAAETMQKLSREIRTALVTKTPVDMLKATLMKPEFQSDAAIPCLCQMLSVGDAEIRQLLVKQLAGFSSQSAGEALAKLALYDLDPGIRAQAIEALKDKPGRYYRSMMLAAFRHPWPVVADHAAEALATLGDRASLPELRELEKLPDPRQPVKDPERGYIVPELVRINHLKNCTLCHAPSQESRDLVRGRMPTPGQPLPPPIVYYEDSSPGIFVRADTTYLRQDFSVMQSVSNHGPWPEWQRYDYLVRQRPVSSQEATWLLWAPHRRGSDDYPQRDAVRFAIKELSAWYTLSRGE